MEKEDLLRILKNSNEIIYKEEAIARRVKEAIQYLIEDLIKSNIIGSDAGYGRWIVENYLIDVYGSGIVIYLIAVIKECYIHKNKINTRLKVLKEVKDGRLFFPYGWECNYAHQLRYEINIDRFDEFKPDLNFEI